LVIDLIKIGAAKEDGILCEVYDLWTGQHIGNYHGKYMEPNSIMPHDNVALKIKCGQGLEDGFTQKISL